MRRTTRRRPLSTAVTLTGITLFSAACASSPNAGEEFLSRDLLTHEQIAAVRAVNAFEAVERLKSHWLRPVGRSQLPPAAGTPQFRENAVQVYLDDQRLGGIENLRGIEIAAVRYIRYIPPAQAAARWGFNNAGGAIFVSTQPLDR